MRKQWIRRTALTVLLVAGACRSEESSTITAVQAVDSMKLAQAAAPRSRRPGDDELLEVGRRVPGFGGMFIGRDGRLNLYLRNPSERSRAVSALTAVFGRIPSKTGQEPVVHAADYDVAQLAAWHEQVNATWKEGRYVLTSVAEESNRVKIGYESAADTGRIVRIIGRLGIPRAAILLEQVQRPQRFAHLREHYRPTSPGYAWVGENGGGQGGSLGLVFRRADNPYSDYMLANSHSFRRPGIYDSEEVYQPGNYYSGGVSGWIGIKAWDRPFDWCPRLNAFCRQADAAVVQLWSPGNFGYIARTTGSPAYGPYAGAGSIDVTFPFWQIVGRSGAYSQWVGVVHHKVGQITGWTAGQLTDSCADVFWGFDGTNEYYIECTSKVGGVARQGDSGSPVFMRDPGNPDGLTVLAAGLLWGGAGDAYFLFSRIEQFVAEYGSAIVLYPGDPGY